MVTFSCGRNKINLVVLHSNIVSLGAVDKEVNNFSKMNKMMILKSLKVPWDSSPKNTE